jgi:predicted PurR-regulated permease PerM
LLSLHPDSPSRLLLLPTGWVFTIIITAAISAIIFLMGTHIPSKLDQRQLIEYQNAMLQQGNNTLTFLSEANAALPTADPALSDSIQTLGTENFDLLNSTKWLATSDVTGNFESVQNLLMNFTDFAVPK